MKRKTLSKALMTSVGACVLATTMGMSASAGERTLRFTTQLPAKNFATLNAIEFTQCVADKTEINIEVYDSAQLYRDKEVPQAVSSGAIDMGMTTTARFSGTIPAIEILYVPFAMGSRKDIVGNLAPGAGRRFDPAGKMRGIAHFLHVGDSQRPSGHRVGNGRSRDGTKKGR